MNMPTTDGELKIRLRQLYQPVHLFGEGIIERTERLRNAIVKYAEENGSVPKFGGDDKREEVKKVEEFFTEGGKDLRDARLEIAKFSIPRSKARLQIAKAERAELNRQEDEKKYQEEIQSFPQYELEATQYADERAVSRGALSPDESLFATSGWSGDAKIHSMEDSSLNLTLIGHTD